MRYGPRAATLLATGLLGAACSAEERTAHASPTSDANITAARPDDGATGGPIALQTGPTMLRERILILSDRGQLTAQLVDNQATRALVKMLPITIEMRDHLRQEKTGTLPSPLSEMPRQSEFSAGTLGLWGNDDFVIYYRSGRVPPPGIILLGHVIGDLSSFERPGAVGVRIQRAK